MRVEELARRGGRLRRVCPLLWRDRYNGRSRSHSRLYMGTFASPGSTGPKKRVVHNKTRVSHELTLRGISINFIVYF